MADLASIQSAFKSHILTGDGADAISGTVLGTDAIPADDRMNIHRNNYRESLTDALYSIFPVMKTYVGEEFLRAMLRRYVNETPPRVAMLAVYGERVGDFVDTFKPAEKLPYLGDLARLEYGVHAAQNAADGYDENTGVLKSLILINSPYPVLGLWMVGTEQLVPEAVHLDAGGQIAAVGKIGGEVRILPLDPDQYKYIQNRLLGELNTSSDSIEHLADMGLIKI